MVAPPQKGAVEIRLTHQLGVCGLPYLRELPGSRVTYTDKVRSSPRVFSRQGPGFPFPPWPNAECGFWLYILPSPIPRFSLSECVFTSLVKTGAEEYICSFAASTVGKVALIG